MTGTNPLWYLSALPLVPASLGTTARQNWLEGFMAGAEWNDKAPDLPTAEALGHYMFTRQASEYEADEQTRENVWENAGVREFWTEEARAILSHIEDAGIASPHEPLA